MWHYIIAGLFSTVLYFKWGKEVAWGFFLSFLAYKMYKAIKFMSKGKSETILGHDGEILEWHFKGALFSFSADLETMTGRFIAPFGNTTIHDRWHSHTKYIKGSVDVEIPLRAISIYTHDETETRHISYSETAFGYRTDGSFGQGYVPNVLTTSGKTGNVSFSLYTYKGSPKGDFEVGKENLAWTCNGSDWDKSYSPRSSISRRQAKSFLEGWSVIENAIKERSVGNK